MRLHVLLVALSLVIAGCHPKPIAGGAHQRLPDASDRLLVVGNQPSAVSAAITWLQARGLSAVEAPDLYVNMPDRSLIERARGLRAHTLVLVQSTGDLRAPMVSVRGIETDSHAVLWSGYARAASYRSSPAPDRVARLTCHALAAAWNGAAGAPCE